MSDDDRRGGERHVAWFPVRVDGDDVGQGVAIAKNVSRGGLLLASYQKFVVGAPVTLTLHLDPDTGEAREVEGTIVRLESNSDDPAGMWPHKLAIEFDDPDPELLAEVLAAVYAEDSDEPDDEAANDTPLDEA